MLRDGIHPQQVIPSQMGSILILVMWVVIMLSIFSFSIAHTVHRRLDMVKRLEDRVQLRATAEAGVKKMIDLLKLRHKQKVSADALKDNWSHNRGGFKDIAVGDGFFSVSGDILEKTASALEQDEPYYGAVDEERKLNINHEKTPRRLKQLIQIAAEISAEEANVISASLIDWIDEDDHRYESGAESRYYEQLSPPYAPTNQPFQTLEEIKLVKGMTEDIYNKISPFLSVYSDAYINVNTVGIEVFRSVGGTETVGKKLLQYRAGRDKIAGTRDDRVVTSTANLADELNRYLYLDDKEQKLVTELVTAVPLRVTSAHFMVQSHARLKHGSQMMHVSAVVTKEGQILHWNERFVNHT